MKKESTLKHYQEQDTCLLNKNNRISIKYKIFIVVLLFVILNIIINILVIRLFINDIYLSLEKKELKREFRYIKNNINNETKLTMEIYNANNNGIKIKILDNNYNALYTIFNDKANLRYGNINLILLNTLKNNETKIITLKDKKESGYDLYLVGKTNDYYVIISSSIDSLKKDASSAIIVITITFSITLLILLIITYFISKLFSKKINEIKEVTNNIANLKFDKKIEVTTDDELGDLLNNINEMSKKLESNIKDLEKANEKLKHDLLDKEKQEQIRKKLITNISHEFKTPLTIISGYSQLLLDDLKDNENKENIKFIINETKRLGDLVHEFLELSKLESGKVLLNKENININKIIDEEVEKFSVEFNKKKIKVIKKYECKRKVSADKKQIIRVIDNLLTNAIKFCKNDKLIKINTNLKDEYFVLEVFNTGDKIKEKDLENIFNSYYKDKSKRNKEGNGLGLAIVKVIMDLHGGVCCVKNEKQGVRFIIKLKV